MTGPRSQADGPVDAGDARVRDHYRKASTETVPEHLDEQVLRHAADAAGRGGWRRHEAWFRPLGIAAAVALSLVVLLETDTPSPSAVVEDFSSAATEATDRIRDLGEATSASRPPGDPTATGGASGQDGAQRYCTEQESGSAASWRGCIDRLQASGRVAEADAERRLLLRAHPPADE